MKNIAWTATAALVALGTAGAGKATITPTVEAAGAEHSSRSLAYGGEAGFDGLSTRYYVSHSQQFGPVVSAEMYDFTADPATGGGGAGGTGNYLSASSFGTVLTFVNSTVNYFGLWVSTIGKGDTVAFYKGGNFVAEYDLGDLFAALVTNPAGYLGNPSGPFQGDHPDAPFAFFNFQSDQVFDEIWLTQNGRGLFEMDNLTLGYATRTTAAATPMPEPASWATMLVGFGVAGVAMRRRARRVLAA